MKMSDSVLLLTTLVAAALFTAVLGGPYARRGHIYQNYGVDLQNDKAQAQAYNFPVPCNVVPSCLLTPNAQLCRGSSQCSSNAACCFARHCLQGVGVCSNSVSSAAKAVENFQIETERKAQAKVQSPGPDQSDNAQAQAYQGLVLCNPVPSCLGQNVQLCQTSSQCGSNKACCVARHCLLPGEAMGVCISTSAKVENFEREARVKVQSPGPESCPGPIKQCTITSQFCNENSECDPPQKCCEAACGIGVCSSVREAELEGKEEIKAAKDRVAKVEHTSPKPCPGIRPRLSCNLPGQLCTEPWECESGQCCEANECAKGYGVCKPVDGIPNVLSKVENRNEENLNDKSRGK